MDDLDNKSLRQLAGLKKIITECGEPMGPSTGAKIPASLNLTADSGPELSGMLRDIMSLAGLHKVEPEHMPPVDSNMLDAKVSTSPTMASLIGRMDDIADPEGEVKEVDEVPGYANSPEAAYSGENFPMGTGDINNDTTAAKDALVSKANESMPEELMQEYRKFTSETNNPDTPGMSDEDFNTLGDAFNNMTPAMKAQMVASPEWKKISDMLKGRYSNRPQQPDTSNPAASGTTFEDDNAANVNPPAKPGLEVVDQTGGGTKSEQAGKWSPDLKQVDVVAQPKGSTTRSATTKPGVSMPISSGNPRAEPGVSPRNNNPKDDRTNESSDLRRLISQISAKYDVDSKILEAALPSIVARLTEAKKKPSAGMTKKEKSEVVKKAKKGEDIGKPGKNFKKVEAAAKKSGAKDPKAVAAAAMWKNEAKKK